MVAQEIPCHRVWENERFLAVLDIHPVREGHLLVLPKAHTDYLFDLSSSEYHDVWEVCRLLSEPLRRTMGSKRIGVIVEGFQVPHLHVHLIPVDGGNQLDPCLAQAAEFSGLAHLAEKIREGLSR